MSLEPLIAEGFPISWHALAALTALVLGASQFLLPKGTLRHRIVGFTWAALLMFIAASGFLIHELRMFGPWSVIHLLSILVLITVPMAAWAAHSHRVKSHRNAMIQIYVFALIGAGLFTLLPGRVMHEVVFG
jgi:uncharacterized membrane protein